MRNEGVKKLYSKLEQNFFEVGARAHGGENCSSRYRHEDTEGGDTREQFVLC